LPPIKIQFQLFIFKIIIKEILKTNDIKKINNNGINSNFVIRHNLF
jgi:hypothetical protein